jgi:TonB family protein
MFETTLAAAQPDRLRTHRLIFATLISVGMTTFGLAGSWTLDRLDIDRVGGPRSSFELVEYSLLAPKPVDPPPPPPEVESRTEGGDPGPVRDMLDEPPSDAGPDIAPPTNRIPDIGSKGDGRIPTIGGGACPPHICGIGTNTATTGNGCVGPHCGVSQKPDPAPAEVSFSALHCLACSDPDRAQLRRTASSMRKRGGDVALRFCVDERGRVEAGSIDVTESFGDIEVDRIARAAVAGWRFKPMQIAGAPRRACRETHFRITFD